MRMPMLLTLVAGLLVLAGCYRETVPDYGPAVRSLDTALEQARSTDRNVLVIYGSDSCPWSRSFERNTLADADVREALGSFVVLLLEKGENSADFEKAWGNPPTPSVVTLGPDGKPLGTMLSGVVKKDGFLTYTAWAKSGTGPQPAIAVGGG